MGAVLLRVAVVAGGLAAGEFGITALFSGDPIWLPELGLAFALFVTGLAGFMRPLLTTKHYPSGGPRP